MIPSGREGHTPGDETVVTAGRSQHGGVGRYHRDHDCWTLAKPARQRQRRERRLADAVAEGYWECPLCCEPPVCCAQGQHGASYALPLLAPAEAPEWERELVEGAKEE